MRGIASFLLFFICNMGFAQCTYEWAYKDNGQTLNLQNELTACRSQTVQESQIPATCHWLLPKKFLDSIVKDMNDYPVVDTIKTKDPDYYFYEQRAYTFDTLSVNCLVERFIVDDETIALYDISFKAQLPEWNDAGLFHFYYHPEFTIILRWGIFNHCKCIGNVFLKKNSCLTQAQQAKVEKIIATMKKEWNIKN